MKKIYYFFAAAMICLTAASCTQELNDGSLDGNLESSTEGTIPDNYIELTFASPNMDVKTSVEGNTVSWSQGDKIRICWNGGSIISKEVAIQDGTAYFTAMVAPEATEFYAVYPASIEAEVTEDKFNITIPASQSGRFADADIIVAKTTLDELSYAFHHTVSLVKFVVSTENEKGISRASFVDLANESQLIGTMAITFDDNNGIAERTVTEDLTLDVIDVTAVQPGENYMAVIPGKQLAGFGLRLGSSSKWYTGLVGENPQTLGERLNLGEVDTKIHEGDFYIKHDGTGKGTSWADAGGPELLASLIDTPNYRDVKNLAQAWRLDGKTIKLAVGEYVAPNGSADGFRCGFHTATKDFPDGVSFTMEGGYVGDGEATSPTEKTIFGNSTTDTGKRALFLYMGVNVTLKNVSFEHNTREHDGGAIRVYGAGYLKMDNCILSNNKGRSGGGLSIENGSKLILSNCNFESNSSTKDGGAINISTGAHLSAVNTTFITNTCTINNTELPADASNRIIGQGGGAIKIATSVTETTTTATNPVTVSLESCIFDGNHAKYSTGGAFYSVTSHLKLTANKCKFLNNHSNGNYASAVFALEQPAGVTENNLEYVYFNSCEFRGNYAEDFTSHHGPHIAYIHYAYTCLGFNNCLFYGNSTKQSLFYIYTRGALIFANSTFVDTNSKGSTSLVNADNITVNYPANICNNIILNSSTKRFGFTTSTWDSDYLKFMYNLYGTYTFDSIPQETNKNVTSIDSPNAVIYSTYEDGYNAGVDTGMSYYSWSGSIDDFLYTSKTNVANAIKSNTKFGEDFYNWLTSLDYGKGLNALDVDIRGVTRGNTVWPGSYQN